MKKISLITVVLLSAVSSAAQWVWQSPLPTGNPLSCVFFTDSVTGWIVGDAGTILKTNDGAKTWGIQKCPVDENLTSVFMIGPDTGYVASNEGTLLKTTDGGAGWVRLDYTSMHPVSSLFFINPETGWMTTNPGNNYYDPAMLFKTTDGGLTWDTLYFSDNYTSLYFTAIHFTDPDTGWVTGADYNLYFLMTTADGGETWSVNRFDYGAMNDVHFVSPSCGYAVGYTNDSNGQVFATRDGGLTWRLGIARGSIPSPHASFRCVSVLNDSTLWVGGGAGTIIHSGDGGLTWNNQYSGLPYDIRDIQFISERFGWAVDLNGSILVSHDGGNTWNHMVQANTEDLHALFFTDAQNGWAAGAAGTLVKTTDGGNTWVRKITGIDLQLNTIWFTDPQNGWIGGDEGLLIKTSDGGDSWGKVPVEIPYDINKVVFTGADQGYIACDSGLLMRTVDGGLSWNASQQDPSRNITGLFFLGADTGWMSANSTDYYSSQSQFIMKTTDGGESWILSESPITGYNWENLPEDIRFLNADTGFYVFGQTYKTTDGGNTWNYINTGISMHGIAFSGNNTAWLIGDGTLLSSYDYFMSWDEIRLTSKAVNYICFPDKRNGWVAGIQGSILHADLGNLTGTDNSRADMLSALNYPNPFSGSTTLCYVLKDASNVRLEVYNTYGQRVDMQEMGLQQAGQQRVLWYAGTLPPGVYTFRLYSGTSFSQGKMLIAY